MSDFNGRPRLHRSRDRRMLFGVCGGLAEYFNLDPSLVRIAVVIAALFPPLSPVSLIGYIALAVILPVEGVEELPGRDQVRRNLEGLRSDAGDLATGVRERIANAVRGR